MPVLRTCSTLSHFVPSLAADALWSLKIMSEFSKQRQSGCGSSSRASASESDALPCLRCLRFFLRYPKANCKNRPTSSAEILYKKSLKKLCKIWVICTSQRRHKSKSSNQLKANSSSEEFTRGGGGGLQQLQGLQVLQVLQSLGLLVQLAHLECLECLGCPGCPE